MYTGLIQSSPVGANVLFYQYQFLAKRLSEAYLGLEVLRRFFRGEYMHPLDKLEYPSLPKRSKFGDYSQIYRDFCKIQSEFKDGSDV